MNERTQELIKQFATDLLNRSGYDMREYEPFLQEAEKFAELIVRECAHLVGGYVKENEFGSATDVKEAYEEITKHFGVEG